METKVICTVSHPKSSLLAVDIKQGEDDGVVFFYFDDWGDSYSVMGVSDESNLEFDSYRKALSACMIDALEHLDSKYNGSSFVDYMTYSERKVFATV